MKRYKSVVSSDSINRYGDRFSVGALVSALYDDCLLGIPNLVAHDQSRPLGWGYPIAIHIEPGLTRLVDVSLIPETEEDRKRLNAQFNYHYYETRIKPYQNELNQLRALLEDNLSDNEKVIANECIAFYEPNLAARVFPDLFAQKDKDGLVPLNVLRPIGLGVYKIGKLVVFAHHYFRRNLFRLNTLNYPVLDQLQDIAVTVNTVKIALDPDMVGLAASFKGEGMELQYWWGPKFNEDLTSIPLGVTHHEASDIDKMFFGISATQFRWGTNDGQHIFEAEELRDFPSAIETPNKYGCRYVHSIVDKASSKIIHFDGAVRLYSEDKMIERLGLNLDKAPRDTEYTKLWRVDYAIDIPTWKRLLSDYYRDNYLIGEYLGAEDEYITGRNEIKSTRKKTLSEKFVPYSMKKDTGVRVVLSYCDISNFDGEYNLQVIPLDKISDGVHEQSYVESDALELKKALQRKGFELYIPNEIQYLTFRDLYVNFPLIFLSRSSLPDNLYQMLTAIKEIVAVWQNKGQDRVVCYKIGFPVDADRAAIISFLGQVDDLGKWFSSGLCYPPITPPELRDWAEHVSDYLKQTFPILVDAPPLAETLMDTGVLLIDRKPITYANFEIQYSGETQGHIYSLPIPENEVELAKALEKEGIGPGLGMRIESSSCTRCRETYRSCGCSKLLDEDVTEEILKATPFPFWTDRPVW
jgi:hypothetical protein